MTHKKIEYKTVTAPEISEEKLKVLGLDGWEMVVYNSYQNYFCFKRSLSHSTEEKKGIKILSGGCLGYCSKCKKEHGDRYCPSDTAPMTEHVVVEKEWNKGWEKDFEVTFPDGRKDWKKGLTHQFIEKTLKNALEKQRREIYANVCTTTTEFAQRIIYDAVQAERSRIREQICKERYKIPRRFVGHQCGCGEDIYCKHSVQSFDLILSLLSNTTEHD